MEVNRMPKTVLPAEAKSLMDDEGHVYIDVRSVPEFEGGHPAGAYNLPLMHLTAAGMQPNADFVSAAEARFPKDQKIIVGCKSGGRSARAAAALASAGFLHVVDQTAGVEGKRDAFGGFVVKGWAPAGLPMATVAEPGRDWESLRTK
jgi:rhodanese-related sulfurtransferase